MADDGDLRRVSGQARCSRRILELAQTLVADRLLSEAASIERPQSAADRMASAEALEWRDDTLANRLDGGRALDRTG